MTRLTLPAHHGARALPLLPALLFAACLDQPAPVTLSSDPGRDASTEDAGTGLDDTTTSDAPARDDTTPASPGTTPDDTTPDTSDAAPETVDPCAALIPGDATIVIQEGDEFLPQTRLHLSVTGVPPECIAAYRWELDQPIGSQSLLMPSSTAPSPTVEVNVAGSYTVRVELIGVGGQRLATPVKMAFAHPGSALHIELLWTTPGDPDPYDAIGTDLDLHFAHPNGRGDFDGDGDGQLDPWFDLPFDTFWYNAAPNWGSSNPDNDDNPSLDRDDTDGAGPENLNLNAPEAGKTYHVGVHYFADHGLGPSFATVRIYVFGNLVFEQSDVELHALDLWWVTDLTWPIELESPLTVLRTCQGTATPCTTDADCETTCDLRITPHYTHPFFPAE